ncbi:MAG: hypothetical protein RL365_563 [Bacteroidota bacterium]
MPSYETSGAAGMDVRANIIDPICVAPGERVLVPTGLFLEIPAGLECQVRPRSGLASKKGITVLNTPGTIDSDYRGEVGVILINLSNEKFTIEPNDRIAQLVFCPVIQVTLIETGALESSDRGTGGFGSTGKN